MLSRRQWHSVILGATWLGQTACGMQDSQSQIGLPSYKILDRDERIIAQPPPPSVAAMPAMPQPFDCTVQWKEILQFGSAQDDEIQSIVVDEERNLYFTGYENGQVTRDVISPIGNSQAFLGKLGADGSPVWRRYIDTTSTDVGVQLAFGSNKRDIFVLGRTQGSLPGFANKGLYDIFVNVFNAAGELGTAFLSGDERSQHPTSLDFTASGDVLVGGYDDIYVLGTAVISLSKPFVYKINISTPENPSVSTLYKADGLTFDYFTSLRSARNSSNDIYFSTVDSAGAIVHKISDDPGAMWTRQFTDSMFELIRGIAISPSGAIFLTGSATAVGGSPPFPDLGVFVAAVDVDRGDVQSTAWARTLESDMAIAATTDVQGNIYITGRTQGNFMPGSEPSDLWKLFVLKFSPAGKSLTFWQRELGMNTFPLSLSIDKCGTMYVGGYTTENLAGPGSSKGGRDAFLLHIPPSEWRSLEP